MKKGVFAIIILVAVFVISACDKPQVFTEIYPDSDGDGLKDDQEAELGTDKGNPDSDGDGTSDGQEVARRYDPLDAQDVPPRSVLDFVGCESNADCPPPKCEGGVSTTYYCGVSDQSGQTCMASHRRCTQGCSDAGICRDESLLLCSAGCMGQCAMLSDGEFCLPQGDLTVGGFVDVKKESSTKVSVSAEYLFASSGIDHRDGWDPLVGYDTDGDGLPDMGEYFFGTSHLDADSDDDGISDLQEWEQRAQESFEEFAGECFIIEGVKSDGCDFTPRCADDRTRLVTFCDTSGGETGRDGAYVTKIGVCKTRTTACRGSDVCESGQCYPLQQS